LKVGGILGAVESQSGSTNHIPNMKKNILLAVPLSLMAAALVLSFRAPVNAEAMIGYATVLALVGVAALEYRITWKRIFGRA
jgi:hypothetical protein